MSKKILFFGDGFTTNYEIDGYWSQNDVDVSVQRYPDLKLFDTRFYTFLELLTIHNDYDLIVISIGSNDVRNGKNAEQLKKAYFKVKTNNGFDKVLIVGPHGDIDTNRFQISIDEEGNKSFSEKNIEMVCKKLVEKHQNNEF